MLVISFIVINYYFWFFQYRPCPASTTITFPCKGKLALTGMPYINKKTITNKLKIFQQYLILNVYS